MPRFSILPFATAVALALTTACAAPEPSAGNARDSASAAHVARAPWHARVRTLDLTGDEVADSVRLTAMGDDPDSLAITLTLLVGGEEKHREEWGSSYELSVVDSASRTPAKVETTLKARLDSVVASVVLQRLDAPGVVLMAEDRAILDDLSPRPTHRVSFSYGFESTARLAWDAPRQRFVRLFSCC